MTKKITLNKNNHQGCIQKYLKRNSQFSFEVNFKEKLKKILVEEILKKVFLTTLNVAMN